MANVNINIRDANNKVFKVIQINLNRSHAATALLLKTAEDKNIDFALVQEMPFSGGKVTGFEGIKGNTFFHKTTNDSRPKAGIVVFKKLKNIDITPLIEFSDELH